MLLTHGLRAAVPKKGPIQFLGSATSSVSSAGSGRPVSYASNAISGVQSGDLLIVMISDDFSNTLTIPSGWTTAFNNSGFDGTSTATLVYKITDSSSTAFSLTTPSLGIPSSVMFAFRNAIWGGFQNSGTNTLTAPTITVSANNSALVLCAFGQDSTPLYTFPSGYTGTSVGSGSSDRSVSGMCYQLSISSGSVSPGSFGGATAANTMRVTTVQLN
jgi:hypothetical protein